MKTLNKQNNSIETINNILGWMLISLVFLLLITFLVREVSGFDVWFHLKAGQWIVENCRVPACDMFSYTASENQYLDSHWLFQVILYLVYSMGGITGIQLLRIIVFIFAFVCLLKIARKNDMITSSLFLFTAVMITQERFLVRPEMPTVLFTGLYFLILHNYSHKETKMIWLLPLLQLAWANMHGLFIIGLIIVLAYLAGGFIAGILKLRQNNHIWGAKWNKLLIIMLLMLATCFINPYGIRGVSYPFLLFTEIGEGANAWMKTVGELQPSFSASGESSVRFYYILLIALTGMSFLMNIKRINITYLILYLGFLYISVKARRNMSLFAFIAAPVAIINIRNGSDKIIEFTRKHNKFINVKQSVFAVFMIILSVIWIINVSTNTYYIRKNDAKRFGLGMSKSLYPAKAVDFILKNNLTGNIFNANCIGGYLIWRLNPERKVFVDGRWEVYGQQFMDRYKSSLTDVSSFNKIADEYDINYTLFTHYSMESRRLLTGLYGDAGWKLVWFDDIASIFIRNTPGNADVIKNNPVDFNSLIKEPKRDLKLFQDNNFKKGSFFYSIEKYRNAECEFKQATLINPRFYEAFNNLGNVYRKKKKNEKAADAYKKAIQVKPDYLHAHVNLANLYSLTGEYEKAEAKYREIIAMKPGDADTHYELALTYEKQENKKLFLKELEEATRINPDHFKAHLKLAEMYTKSDIDRTITELKETVRVQPDFARGYYNLGIAYLQKGQKEETARAWSKYLTLKPDTPDAHKVKEWLSKYRNKQ